MADSSESSAAIVCGPYDTVGSPRFTSRSDKVAGRLFAAQPDTSMAASTPAAIPAHDDIVSLQVIS
jgi:hypothetical protein